MGWSLEDRIKQMIEGQENEDQFDLEKDIVADYWISQRLIRQSDGKDMSIPISVGSEQLRLYVCKNLKDKGQREITKHRFSILKRELGWQEGYNARKDSNRHGRMMLTYDSVVLKNLGLENWTQRGDGSL